MSASSKITARITDASDLDTNRLLLLVLDNLVWPILLVTFIAFSVALPQIFTQGSNVRFLLYQSAGLGAIALAEAVALLSGNFDLSVGPIAGFSAMATALFLTKWAAGVPGILGYPFIVLVGGLIGLINGLFIAKFGVNPFLQTLSAYIILDGGMLVLSVNSIFNLPSSYVWLGGASITLPLLSTVPVAVLFFLLLFACVWFVLVKTRFGRAIYAVGGDEDSAAEAGINTDRVVISVFVISGVLSAIGGLLLTGFNHAATSNLGTPLLFPAFAAAVIGGISLDGGRGNVFNVLGGVILLGTIQAGLTMMSFGPQVNRTINGVVLFAAILLYTWVNGFRGRLLSDL